MKQLLYVLGFLWDEQGNVLLIKKEKPDWQAGFLNGIGGKIEPNEDPFDAIVREVKEETNCDSTPEDYRLFGEMIGEKYQVYLFVSRTVDISKYKQMTNEELFLMSAEDMDLWNIVPNLKFVIPLSLYKGFSYTIFEDYPHE